MRIDDTTHIAYRRAVEHIAHIWPTIADLAADLGKPYTTVAAWKQRGRIPADHDAEIIAAAAKRGETITFEEMAKACLASRHSTAQAS